MIPPRISVFTPSHDARFLDECWRSLEAQTFRSFEWVVVLNGDAADWTPPGRFSDGAEMSVDHVPFLRGVGMTKAYTADLCQGDILVELDHDDLLTVDALAAIEETYRKNPLASLVYSDGAQITETGDADRSTWDQRNGWEYADGEVMVGLREVDEHGHYLNGDHVGVYPRRVLGVQALEPTPHNVSLIWFAPNHVRAFRRDTYAAVGGYDPDRVILDDQDLMMRLWRAGRFVRIPRVLYLQRVHDRMTQVDPTLNPRIQAETVQLYDANIEANALAWARREGLHCYDLGGASADPEVPATPPGYTTIDLRPNPGYIGDVFDCLDLIEKKDGPSSVGVFRAVDFLEHVHDKIRLMNRIHDLLAPDGLLLSTTPSTDGRGAWQDPTHVSFWNENSFWYYTDANYATFVPEITARFQVSRLASYFPTDWHRDNSIPYVQANLIAVKDGGRRNGGYLHW